MIEKLRKKATDIIESCRYGTVKTSVFLAAVFGGCLVSFFAGQYVQSAAEKAAASDKNGTPATPSEAAVQSGALTATPSFLFPSVASYSDAEPANAEMMRPDQLNLAWLYEEGEDSSQPSDSMAGKLYNKLAVKDAQWISGIYDLYNYTPEQAAPLLGLPIEAVTAPSGIIEDFKRIQVQFYDGDGQESGGSSNARSIVSMANTLHYYGALESMEDLDAYVSKLWEDSHSYSVELGDIYYCDGSCLLEKEEHTEEAAVGGVDRPLASETEAGAGGSPAQESENGRQNNDPQALDGGSQAQNSDAGGESQASGGGSQAQNSGTGGESQASGGGSQAQNSDAGGESLASDGGSQAQNSGAGGESQALDGGSEARNSDTGGESQASGGGAQPVESGSGGKASGSGSTGPGQAPSSASDIEKGEGDENSRCPGHLDLSIHITIKGLRERASLYEADPLNPSLESSPGDWQGWNDTARGWVETLDSQDWYGLYGLNTTALLMGNPLTSSEIDTYMSMLPDDASPMRRAFVKYALTSVGKIPYYWGGKPTASGYTGNDFGSVMTPDEDGRFLRGLDCSGWVNWVYWSVTGRGLGSESTGTLVGSGTAVSKSQLIPGDICIRTGPVGHVVIFLGWTADGKMLCIQETTGNANNVEVGIVASDWNSYRRIID